MYHLPFSNLSFQCVQWHLSLPVFYHNCEGEQGSQSRITQCGVRHLFANNAQPRWTSEAMSRYHGRDKPCPCPGVWRPRCNML